MGSLVYWILASAAFGIISAGFYTWLSAGLTNRARLFVRSFISYTAIALIGVWMLFKIANL